MDREEVEELIFTILKDQNFDFKSYPDLWVNYNNKVLDIVPNKNPLNFHVIAFITQNLDLNYEIIQIFVNYFLKLLKIDKLKKDEVIDLNRNNKREYQNLIDQYYFEMFGEENKIIQYGFFLGPTSWLETNNLHINMELSLSKIQLEEYIKLIKSYEQWIETKLKN